MHALERRLAWPGSEAVADGVLRRIRDPRETASAPRSVLPRRRRTLVILVAALLVLAGIAAAARFAIDLGAITIRAEPSLPGGVPTASIGPATFGVPVSLERAGQIAGFAPQVPAELGAPDLVWADRTEVTFGERTTTIVMAWRPRPGFPAIEGTSWGAVLMEFEGHADVATKTMLEGQARISPASVNGDAAWVISGEHALDLLIDGTITRLPSTAVTVLWNHGPIAFRLETGLDRRDLLHLASGIPG
jgi:hypothetical protein